MTSYTSEQLNGSGSYAPNLTKNTTYTFVVDNPIFCAYLTLESLRNASGYYDESSIKTLSGSFSNFTNIVNGVSSSFYQAAFCLNSGSNSFKFTPAVNISGGQLNLRGTGGITLTINDVYNRY